MSVPRITLWTDPFVLPVRLAVRQGFRAAGVKKESFTSQADAVQRSTETFTVTPGAMYILSAIAGRRIVEPIRWVLLDSLRDILNGELRTEHAEHQDLLDATFGELLGALALALHLKGQAEIVRLIESNIGKTPDFLIIEHRDGQQFAHLLECKGTVKDVNNINAAGKWNLCQDIRNFRDGAAEQLDELLLNPTRLKDISSGATFSLGYRRLKARRFRSAFPSHVVSKNVAVVCIPDGRILRRIKITNYPSRQCCGGRGITCVHCVTSPFNPRQSNAIVVLYQEDVAPAQKLDEEFATFIATYRRAQKAVWADDDNEFRDALNGLIENLNRSRERNELLGTETFVTVSLVEAASDQELDFNDIRTDEIRDAVRQNLEVPMDEPAETGEDQNLGATNLPPEQIPMLIAQDRRRTIDEVIDEAQREKRMRRRERLTVDIDQEDIARRIANRELPPEMKLLLQDRHRYAETNARPYISGSVQQSDGNVVIRLTVHPVDPEGLVELQRYVEEQITRLRGDRNPVLINWREEFVEFQSRRHVVGHSWDPFPYPHIRNNTPGITAWRSNEGRAEIIVRPPPDQQLY